MPLFQGTQQQYYGSQGFTTSAAQATGGANAGEYILTFPENETLLNNLATMPLSTGDIIVTVNGTATTNFTFPKSNTTDTVVLNTPVSAGVPVIISLVNPDLGNYQFISLQTIINNFIISYVGKDKIIPRVRRADVAYHAQRAIQELSYDTFKSNKSQEIEIPPSLKMALPHDYVNYVKVCYVDNDGVERLLYPARKTSNPTAILQAGDYGYTFDNAGNLSVASDSDTWNRYRTNSINESVSDPENYRKNEEDYDILEGRRYGIEPENAQFNGIFYIDEKQGYIHVSGSLSGKTISLKYISDGLGTEDEMLVHKFAEEAMYKSIAYAIASTHTSVLPNYIPLLKRERFASIRNAKLRLSNIKSEELAQVMRGKSKWIKH